MYFVYVLKSKYFKKSYVGATSDLERRIKEHNAGRHYYTKKYMPWEFFWYKKFSTQSEALKKEKYLKSSVGRRHLKKLFEKE